MHTSISSRPRLHSTFGRTAAVSFLAVAGTLCAHAQQSAGAASAPISLKSTLAAPLDLSGSNDLNYSSSTGSAETASAENFNLLSNSENQPPPRRSYSHPNYNDSRTNSDGSAKYTFVVGGGFTLPVGGTDNYLSPGWKIQAGVGRNFNKTFGLIAQFDYDDFSFQTSTLNNQLAIYNSLCTPAEQAAGVCSTLTQLSGYTHDWSFTLNPIMNYYTSDTFGAYVIAGLGFYHKTANFTTPGVGVYCDPFYGCYSYSANQTVDSYTSNAFGLNGGLGVTYKFSRFASTKFYAEARYVWTDNSPRPFDISGTTSYFNAFPQNSARTTYIPVTFGVRF
jgi:hypothetical protein